MLMVLQRHQEISQKFPILQVHITLLIIQPLNTVMKIGMAFLNPMIELRITFW